MQNRTERHYSCLLAIFAATSMGVSVWTGCSKSSQTQQQASTGDMTHATADSTADVSAGYIVSKRADSYGHLVRGYDAKRRRFTDVVEWCQKSKEKVNTAYGIVLFLEELSQFLSKGGSLKTTTNSSGWEVTEQQWNSSLELQGLQGFSNRGRMVSRMKVSLGTTELAEPVLEQQISFTVEGEPVSFKLGAEGSAWAMSSAAAQAIEKYFKSAGGRIIDEASVVRKDGRNIASIDTAWLMAIEFDKAALAKDNQ